MTGEEMPIALFGEDEDEDEDDGRMMMGWDARVR